MWNATNTSHEEFKLYDYAYHNSSYDRLFFENIYYPDGLSQIYLILYGLIDANSTRAKHLYAIHSYYSNPKWYKYEIEDNYPHMENLEAVLMCDESNFEINGRNLNMEYEIEMAISKILEWETKEIGEYTWNCQEAGNTINAINMYLNKNCKRYKSLKIKYTTFKVCAI